jgi:hypothetical protein
MTRPVPLPALLALVVLTTGCGVTADSAAPEAIATTASPEARTVRVEVEMGHCFVEPVLFDGRRWNVPFDKQFGWGGLEPRNWVGTGVMKRVSQDRARFDDDGGSTVVFLPVNDPAVRPVEKALCH